MGYINYKNLEKFYGDVWDNMSIEEREKIIREGVSSIPSDLRFAKYKWNKLPRLVRAQLVAIMERLGIGKDKIISDIIKVIREINNIRKEADDLGYYQTSKQLYSAILILEKAIEIQKEYRQ